MKSYQGLLVLVLMTLTSTTFAATYSINTNNAGEQVLDRAIAPGGSHAGNTKNQVLQKFVNTDLRRLSDEQLSHDSREMDAKIKVSTSTAAAKTALNSGIAVPTVTPIPNQTNQINDVVSISLSATDPDALPLQFVLQDGPPGVVIGSDPVTGEPKLRGTITATGTFPTVTVRAYKFSDIFGFTTFSWVVSP
jgi:hypothetical protein